MVNGFIHVVSRRALGIHGRKKLEVEFLLSLFSVLRSVLADRSCDQSLVHYCSLLRLWSSLSCSPFPFIDLCSSVFLWKVGIS